MVQNKQNDLFFWSNFKESVPLKFVATKLATTEHSKPTMCTTYTTLGKRWKIRSSFLFLILLQFFFIWKKDICYLVAKILKYEKSTPASRCKKWNKRPGRLFECLPPVLVLLTVASMNNLEDKHYAFLKLILAFVFQNCSTQIHWSSKWRCFAYPTSESQVSV